MDLVLLIVSLATILFAAELFTNAIEWFGRRLNLAEGAVGSVLAAVATATPETLIPVIAILGPLVLGGQVSASSEAVGVGAILGAPFMLSTLAMFVTGVAILIFARRRRRTTAMAINPTILGRDVAFFVVGYGLAIGATFLPQELNWLNYVIAAVLVLLYAVYVGLHFRDEIEEPGEHEELARLHALRVPGVAAASERAALLRAAAPNPPAPTPAPRGPRLELDVFPGEHAIGGGTPSLALIVGQLVVALGLIIIGAQVFVGAVEHISTTIGLDPTVLSLIIAPIATELPEKFNSVLWVRNGKDTLAMGNITGAMVFQSCLPTILGLLFTPWDFNPQSAIYFLSAGVAFVATFAIFGPMLLRGRLSGWTLLIGGPLYAIYLYLALFTPLGAVAPPAH